jgi:DNA-binding NarL/FixJ family response regulator
MGGQGMQDASAEDEVAVVVVDDDPIVRAWVRLALRDSAFRLAGEATTAEEALELLGRRRADVVVVDQNLPDRKGTELIRELRRVGNATPALVITASAARGLNELAREAGAQGSILKSSSVEDLVSALRQALAGTGPFDARHPRRAETGGALSPREREALRLVAAGRTNVSIAEELGIGTETVKTMLERAYAKLGVRRRAEAVGEAIRLGLL